MRVADTSCLYAALIAEDVHHAEAREALADPEPILVPHEILAETLSLLQMRKGFRASLEAGAGLRGLPHARTEGATPAIVEAAWNEYKEAGGKLSLPDAIVLAWCRKHGATPLTFDKDILRRR